MWEKLDAVFTGISTWTARVSGQPAVFIVALLIVLIWGVTGPLFHFSETWQLVINTGTTIVTFLMVFLIQNSQNRDTASMQAKLDELLRATPEAREAFIGIEHLSVQEVEGIRLTLEREVCDDRSKKVNRSVAALVREM